MDSLANYKMPDTGKTITHVYPLGNMITIHRYFTESSDLAAQSTGFRWTVKYYDGKEETGTYTAIGGLCGSFQSCYYPLVRRLEQKFTQEISLTGKSDKYFPPHWRVKTDQNRAYVLAYAKTLYGSEFVETSFNIPIPPKHHKGTGNNYIVPMGWLMRFFELTGITLYSN